ncbi:MAG TPA: cytochrome P460 family protein [Terriglobales bacterium]
MRQAIWILVMVAGVGGIVTSTTSRQRNADSNSSIPGIETPSGYRDWKLISVAHEEGKLNDIRAILGDELAVKTYREGKLPFPDGAIIARLAWNYVSSDENNKIFGRQQSFIAGAPTNFQFMVKDSSKYATTGGWGFAQFVEGKPDKKADLSTCFGCHEPVKARDFVFTRYAR